jgi:serine/threonine-protein kinase HipA
VGNTLTEALEVYADDTHVGTVTQKRGLLSFEYDDEWRHNPASFPLSLSIPLRYGGHEGPEVAAFLRGLLPDNSGVRQQWSRRFHVDGDDDFGLLTHVGEDVSGALRFIVPGRDEYSDAPDEEVLSDEEIAWFIERGRREAATWGVPGTVGRFSLAGQQAKMAVARREGKWFAPSRYHPSTHILKPGVVEYDHSELNEFLTMRLASSVGLRTARVELLTFGDLSVVGVERFDRVVREDGTVQRIHQEDMCQSLGVPPEKRYQSDGGPGVEAVMSHLSRNFTASAAIAAKRSYLDALAFNWLTLGTDAHAKNYSIQFLPGGVRLAPLYDLGAGVAYPRQIPPRAKDTKLAQAIGNEYRFEWVRSRHWTTTARWMGRAPHEVIERVREIAMLVREAADEVSREAAQASPEFASIWAAGIRTHAARMATFLDL